MQVDINRTKSEFMDFINIPQLTLTAHQCDKRTLTCLISSGVNMGLTGMENYAYSHTWHRVMNSVEISWSSAHKLIMMREKSQLGEL